MSVFLKTLKLIKPEIQLFSFSLAEYFSIAFPNADKTILSAGRRECFVFTGDQYTKMKKSDLLNNITSSAKIEGIFDDDFTQALPENIEPSNSEIDIIKKFLQSPNTYKTDSIEIDYGALPRIG